MASLPVVMTGAQIQIWANNQQYKQVANITFTVSYGTEEIYGIDSPYAQELAEEKVQVSGTITGFRLKLSGGLQAKTLRPLFSDISAAPYISIRVTDRSTSEDIIFFPQAKVTSETHTIPIKGVYSLNFTFKAIVPYFALDRS
jgi:hypothetical protein